MRLSTSNLNDRLPPTKNERLDAFRGEPLQDADVERLASHMLLLLLLTPNEILKKTENRILLSMSELGPSTNGKDLKKEKSEKFENSNKKLENTDEK